MTNFYDIETIILASLILKPKLMEKLTLKDYHFTKHQRIYQFMKSFYARYGTFDILLMFNTCKDKTLLIDHLKYIADACELITPDNFEMYQSALKQMFEQKKKERWIINKIFDLANDLYVGEIMFDEFESKFEKIKDDANVIFEKGE